MQHSKPKHRLMLLLPALFIIVLGACSALPPVREVPTLPDATPSLDIDRSRAAALYREGLRAQNPSRGGTADAERAAQLIERAAMLGNPDAQFMLAMGHMSGADGSRDPVSAIPWLLRAAQQGHAEAQFRLARLIDAKRQSG